MRVKSPSNSDRFSIVQGFQLPEVLGISFNQVGKFMDQPGSLETSDILSPSGLEGMAGGSNSNIDVFGRSFRGVDQWDTDDLLSRYISYLTCYNGTDYLFSCWV